MLSFNEVREVDRQGMIKDVLDFPEMCKNAFNPIETDISDDFNKIGFVGMGGSGIGGDMLKSYLRNKTDLPVLVNKDYTLPNSFDEDTLVFVVSYSGNTNETLSSFREGVERGCEVVAVSSNGDVEEITEEKNIPLFKVEKDVQPRAGFPYLFLPILATLKEIKPIEVTGFNEAIKELEELKKIIHPSVDYKRNEAKKIAYWLKDSVPVIYSYGALSPVAYRWKCQLNENSKMFSIMNKFPELTHNEVVGWDNKSTKNFKTIILKEKEPSYEIKNKIDATKKELDTSIKIIEVFGDSLLSKLLTGVFFGDLVSVYLATLNEVDPTPVDRIDKIKERISN